MPNPHASFLGKLGGPARAKVLTAAQRKEISKKGAEARWKNHTKKREISRSKKI